MSYAGPLFAAVCDQVKAAVATIGGGAVDPKSVYIATVPSTNAQLPLINVRLPLGPYDSEKWDGAANLKGSTFKVEVCLVWQLPTDRSVDHPYGDASSPGLLTATDDLLNALENARSAFFAASSKLFDYQCSAAAFNQENAAVPVAVTVITINFNVRYIAGTR